jgi:hypothetical protein
MVAVNGGSATHSPASIAIGILRTSDMKLCHYLITIFHIIFTFDHPHASTPVSTT